MRRTLIRSFSILLTLTLLLGGCVPSHRAAQPLTRSALYLDTTVRITLYDAQSAALLDKCMQLIAAREALWSRTIETSDVAQLNAANGQTVTVAPETAELLLIAQQYAKLTDGAFDITVAPLTDLWHAAEQTGAPPSEADLHAAAARVNAAAIAISGCDVTLPAGMAVDLGGIAKGKIADDLSALLTENSCKSALIDLGGNIYAHGRHPDGTPFQIGVLDPRDESALLVKLAGENRSVVTSGSYERQYHVGGRAYSHILDPKSGLPVGNDLLSVTILSGQSVDGDALSTACFVMGLSRAQTFLATCADIDAVFLTTDGRVVMTDGVQTV